MRILVTGANGYLGQGIVKAIIESGNKVIATDFKLDNVDTRATKIECDIFSIEDPYEYFEKPDALLHLAWRDTYFAPSLKNKLEETIRKISYFLGIYPFIRKIYKKIFGNRSR